MRLLGLLVILVVVAGCLAAQSVNHMTLAILVFALGAFVGFAEILVRFRDEPFQAVNSTPGVAYFTINGVAATAVYALVRYLDVTFGAPAGSHLMHVMQVTISAFSGIAFLRSGFFVGKDKNSGDNMMVGPALVLENILAVVSTQVDRERALRRIRFAEELSAKLELAQAQGMLGILSASVQTMPADQAKGISTTAASIGSNADLDITVKVRMLLMLYLTHFGEQAVNAAKPKG